MTNAHETRVASMFVEVNEASVVVANVGSPMASTYTILTLASAEARARVEVGEGGDAPITLLSVGAYLVSTDTIPTLASTGAGVKAGARTARGAKIGLGMDAPTVGIMTAVSTSPRVGEILSW